MIFLLPQKSEYTQQIFTCSKLTIKTLEQSVKSEKDTGMISLT